MKSINRNMIYQGDALDVLKTFPDAFVHSVITSPPYFWLRAYLKKDHPLRRHEIGQEETPEQYVSKLVEIMREIRRVLRPDGTVFFNISDSNAGSGKGQTGWNGIGNQEKRQGFRSSGSKVPRGYKPGDLMFIPARVAMALQADGWWVRSDIVWAKVNCMPESVSTRPVKSHEFVYLLTKSGSPLYWIHRDLHVGVREKPDPDYRYFDRVTEVETETPPPDWRTAEIIDPFADENDDRELDKDDEPDEEMDEDIDEQSEGGESRIKRWKRKNLWKGKKYFYDGVAIREPMSESYLKDGRPPGVLRQRLYKKSKYNLFDYGSPQFATPESNADARNALKKNELLDKQTSSKKRIAEKKAKHADQTRTASSGTGLKGHSGYYDKDGELLVNPELGRNARDVWFIKTIPFKGAHFAVFSPDLVLKCMLAGSSEQGCCATCGAPIDRVLTRNPDNPFGWARTCTCKTEKTVPCIVLDPFMGAGTVAEVALENGRDFIGIELNPDFIDMAEGRIRPLRNTRLGEF